MPFSMLFPVAAGGAATAGAGAGGGWLGGALLGTADGAAGLFGTGGQFGAMQTMGTLGMGMGLAQAFTSQGAAPTAEIKLSPEGEKLEKALFGQIKTQYETGLLPENLASIYIGKIKRAVAPSARIPRGVLSGGKVRGGRQVAGILGEAGERVEGLAAPAKWQAAQRQEEMMSAITNLQNIMNIERQVPILKAQAGFTGSLLSRMGGAAKGQALGDVAQYAAMLKYPMPYPTYPMS